MINIKTCCNSLCCIISVLECCPVSILLIILGLDVSCCVLSSVESCVISTLDLKLSIAGLESCKSVINSCLICFLLVKDCLSCCKCYYEVLGVVVVSNYCILNFVILSLKL